MVLGAARAVMLTRRTAGAAPYTANPVFVSGDDYLGFDSALTGLADGQSITISTWLRVTGGAGTVRRLFSIADVANTRLAFRLNASNQLETIARNASAVEILSMQFGTITDTDWHHAILSFNLANSAQRWAYLDGSPATPTWTTYTNDTIDLAAASPRNRIFANPNTTPGEYFIGDVADLWVNDALFDISVQGNREKFILGGVPVDLGASGATPTGSSPVLFFSGATGSWHTNKGTGGGFTVSGGALTNGTGPVEVGSSTGATPVWASEGAKFQASATGTATASYPATLNYGDFLLMTCFMRADTSASLALHATATAAGFVTLASHLSGARRYIVAWKVSSGGTFGQPDPAAGTTINAFTTAGTTNVAVIAKMDRFTAADGFRATPYESASSTAILSAAGASGPTITPAGSNRRGVCLVLLQGTISMSSAFTGSTPNTWTQATQQSNSTAPGVVVQTQQIDLSSGDGVSGGSNTFDTTRNYATVACALVPS